MILSQDQITRLSREEKVQLMEALWIDLSRSDEDVRSPSWHEECLRETEARYLAGEERVLDWEDAKRELWNRVK
jgi:hypothetical protein